MKVRKADEYNVAGTYSIAKRYCLINKQINRELRREKSKVKIQNWKLLARTVYETD